MSLQQGTLLGPYQITSQVGKGGMGEVYRARDTRLDRNVAIKVLSAALAENQSALMRFEREAKALAALSHPNIVVIYDIGSDRGVSFVAMEYLEGETLRNRITRSALTWQKALEITSWIADGLAAAHSKGVIHRDLKPENVYLTSEGGLKILDFGLALIRRPDSAETNTSTPTAFATSQPGMALGTVPYMSPEQLRGQVVDNRTDIWALGCVLYEMLTQRFAFAGTCDTDTIANILLKEPDWQALPPDLPRPLKELLQRCLQKDAGSRPDIVAVRTEIEALSSRKTAPVSTRKESKPRAPKRIRSLVVLPLTNMSRNPEQDYFVDGMTEALILELAKIGSLRVIARTSAMRYKGTDKSIKEIAGELNVDAVLEGSVLRVGERVRITGELISAARERHLWAETYERDLRDILPLQSEIARTIAQQIRATVTPQEATRLASPRQVHSEAYDAYLKGQFHWYQLSPEHLDNAEQYYRQALQKDSQCALAYAGIGAVNMMRTDIGLELPSKAIPEAKSALMKALALDSSLAEVHVSFANLLFLCDWDWNGAEMEFQRAIELNPSSSDALFFYADFLISMGRSNEAFAKAARALELDPLNFFLQCFYGWHLVYVRRTDEAIVQLCKALRSEPNFSSAHLGLWGAFYQKRMYPEALEEARQFFSILKDDEIALSLVSSGPSTDYAQTMLRAADKLAERSQSTHVPAVRIAKLYAHAGATEQALQYLEKAYEHRENPLIHLKVMWDWDSLRDHPRFQALLHKMNFPVT